MNNNQLRRMSWGNGERNRKMRQIIKAYLDLRYEVSMIASAGSIVLKRNKDQVLVQPTPSVKSTSIQIVPLTAQAVRDFDHIITSRTIHGDVTEVSVHDSDLRMFLYSTGRGK